MRKALLAIPRLATILCAAATGVALFVERSDVSVLGWTVDPLLLLVRLLVLSLVAWAVVGREALGRGLDALDAGGPLGAALERRVLWGLVLAGFAVRFARFHEYGLNADEAQFVWFGAADTLAEVWRYELEKSPHPPANFFLMHGILQLTWSLFWLRLPAVLSGTFLIWVTHRFARPLLGPLVALGAAFLVAFSPGLVDLSRVCRNYMPGFAILVAALAFLVAWLRTERWRDYACFAVLAPLSAFWHYGFVSVFVGIDLALAVLLLARRKPLSVWVGVVAAQLPLAGILLWLYVAHVSGLERTLIPLHHRFYADLLDISPATLLEPIAGAWHYLMKQPSASVLLALSGLGVVDLAVRRQGTALLLCGLPLAVAYGLALAGVMPLGATRHSAYLFPFLFVLALAPFSRLAAAGVPRRVRPLLAGVALASGALVLNGSFLFYTFGTGWQPLSPLSSSRELMLSYPQAEVDRAWALLEERQEDGDLVMLGFQGLMALRMRFEMSPILDPTPEQLRRHDIRIAIPRFPLRHEHAGARYFWSGRVSVAPTPEELLKGVRRARIHFRLPRPNRIWMIRSAWEVPMAELFEDRYPDAQFDREVHETSNGFLFAIDFGELLRTVGGFERP